MELIKTLLESAPNFNTVILLGMFYYIVNNNTRLLKIEHDMSYWIKQLNKIEELEKEILKLKNKLIK